MVFPIHFWKNRKSFSTWGSRKPTWHSFPRLRQDEVPSLPLEFEKFTPLLPHIYSQTAPIEPHSPLATRTFRSHTRTLVSPPPACAAMRRLYPPCTSSHRLPHPPPRPPASPSDRHRPVQLPTPPAPPPPRLPSSCAVIAALDSLLLTCHHRHLGFPPPPAPPLPRTPSVSRAATTALA